MKFKFKSKSRTQLFIKSYSYKICLSLLVSLNDANVIDISKERNLTYKELQNQALQSELNYELFNLQYSTFATLDGSYSKDKTERISALNPAATQTNVTASVGKNFLTGTLLQLDATHLHAKADAVNLTNPLAEEYYQNNFTVRLEQDIWPNFFGNRITAQQTQLYLTSLAQREAILLENINQIKSTLGLYWKAKALAHEKSKNIEIQKYYETLISKARERKSNGLTSPGEYEQVAVEYKLRKQQIDQNDSDLLATQTQLLNALELKQGEMVIDYKFNPEALVKPRFNKVDIHKTSTYITQKAKVDAAEQDYDSVKFNASPDFSVYATYTKQGLEGNQKDSVQEMLDENKNRYVVGLKMSYFFDNKSRDLEQIVKKNSYEIESRKLKNLEQNLAQTLNDMERNITILYNNIQDYKEIVKLRKSIIGQLRNTYQQGRTDISIYIDANNSYISSEVQLVNLMGQYYQAVYEYQSQLSPRL